MTDLKQSIYRKTLFWPLVFRRTVCTKDYASGTKDARPGLQACLKVLASHGAQIDTTTSNGRLIFGVFASLAEFERELIVERTHDGLKAARARGRRLGGRPPKMDAPTLRMAMASLADPQTLATSVAKRLGVSTATLYTYLNGDGTLKRAGEVLLQKG